jgi:phosphoribosylaminoimidazolecarboxamide formyltransferase / IMP cyclohydrolase
MQDIKKMYRTIMDDHFPEEMKISFGNQNLIYRKRAWKIFDADMGGVIEKAFVTVKILVRKQRCMN